MRFSRLDYGYRFGFVQIQLRYTSLGAADVWALKSWHSDVARQGL